MPWHCRMVPAPGFPEKEPGCTPYADLRVGDMWFAPHLLKHPEGHIFRPAPNYYRENHQRDPIVVRLPGAGGHFCVDGCFSRDGKPYGDGWKVSGTPPLLTVQPSINIVGLYHGYLIDGVIGDDVEGRKYDGDGRRIQVV